MYRYFLYVDEGELRQHPARVATSHIHSRRHFLKLFHHSLNSSFLSTDEIIYVCLREELQSGAYENERV